MDVPQETYKSWLKVAQVYNCIDKNYPFRAKMIQDVLKKEININQVMPTRIFPHFPQLDSAECTILHMAAMKRDAEIFQILLDNGANFILQNQSGCTVLHYLFNGEPDGSRNELINSVLSAHVKSANSSNPSDSNGLSHFYIACMANNIEAVQFFLEHSVSVHEVVNTDSPRFPGYSPIHFAAEGCSIETTKLLIKSNADISVKDARGRTALHIFLLQKLKLFDFLSETVKEEANKILEKVDAMDDAINLLLQNDEADYVGLSQFHIACTMQDTSLAEYFIEQVTDINHCINFDSPVWPGYTALHFAAHCNMKIFKMLVQKGASIDVKNAKGLTALDICYKKSKNTDLLSILRTKGEWIDSKFNNGKALLMKLIDAMCDPLQFCSYLQVAVDDINTQVAENPPLWKGFTPLHFAVIVSNDTDTKLIQCCLDRRASVIIGDLHNRTPIHLAFRLKKIEVTILLMERYNGTEDLIDDDGLSFDFIIQQLIKHPLVFKLHPSLSKWQRNFGEDIFKKVGSSNLHAAAYSGNCDALSYQLRPLANRDIDTVISCTDPRIVWSDFHGYTPLHLAVELSSNARIINILLANGACIFATRPDGMTPVYAVLKDVSKDYIIERFVRQLNMVVRNDFQNRNSKLRLEELSGITMLHVACRTFDADAVTVLIQTGADVNAKVHKYCPIWSQYTPLHVLLRYSVYVQDQHAYEKFQAILGMLLAKDADVTAVNGEGDTPVHLSLDHCINHISDYNFVCTSLLMEHHKNFSVNPVNAKKISHFHAACIVNNVEAVEQFLLSGVDVNKPIGIFVENFYGESPLQLALKRILATDNNWKTIDLLLSYGADVHAEDSYGYMVLHRAACDYSKNTELLEKLINCGADVNAKNIFGDTPIEFLLKIDEISLPGLSSLLRSGCHLNSSNSITEEGYLSMIIDNNYHKTAQFKVFERVMKASDLSNIDEIGHTALHNIVTTRHPNLTVINYAEIINQFERLGIDLDHQDNQGKTALHLALQFGNAQAVDALINAGADINIVDSSNKTALTYALESCTPDKYRDQDVIKTLVAHIRKLQFLGFCASELYSRLLEDNNLNASFDSTVLLNERERIREKEVDTQPQLFIDDILLETDALTTYPFTSDLKRKKVEKFLKVVTENLVELKSVLMFQYRQVLKRVVV